MADFNDRTEFDCDEDTFWEKCLLNDDFNQKFYVEHMKFPEWRVIEQKDDGQKITRRVHVSPPMGDMPAAIKKVVGDKFTYVEEGTYDRATRKYTFKVLPSILVDKAKTSGELSTQKLGDKRIARTAKIHIEVKVFVVGSMMEQQVVGDLRNTYSQAATFTKKYLAEKGY